MPSYGSFGISVEDFSVDYSGNSLSKETAIGIHQGIMLSSDRNSTISFGYSIKNYNHAQTVVGRATVAAEGNGIRETWTSTDGTQYAHAWLLLGDTPSEAATTNEAFLLFLDSL